jgi:DNA-binding transcriptional MerR regulator
MTQEQEPLSIDTAARRTGLESHTIHHCVQIGLVSDSLTEEDLVELRRVRRLTELEVNLAGVEIILRMRRRLVELQAELVHLRQQTIRRR